jgi:hypothetical protein
VIWITRLCNLLDFVRFSACLMGPKEVLLLAKEKAIIFAKWIRRAQ